MIALMLPESILARGVELIKVRMVGGPVDGGSVTMLRVGGKLPRWYAWFPDANVAAVYCPTCTGDAVTFTFWGEVKVADLRELEPHQSRDKER